MPLDFDIAIVTALRARPFIHHTMASVTSADATISEHLPIHCFVDADNADFLERYKNIAQLIPLAPEETEIRAQWTDVRMAVMYNFWRCFHWFHDSAKKLLVCEDDISFAPDWIRKLQPIVEDIESKVGDLYALTLYSPYNWPEVIGNDEQPYVFMKKVGFYGSQAMLYSPKARLLMENYLWKEGIEKLCPPADLRVRDGCMAEGIPLLSLTHSLVQHEGYITSGSIREEGDRSFAHRSPTFFDTDS
ncbi:MAG: hypothetical protein ACOY3I_01870 [Verrucomicrobiota bacterium]